MIIYTLNDTDLEILAHFTDRKILEQSVQLTWGEYNPHTIWYEAIDEAGVIGAVVIRGTNRGLAAITVAPHNALVTEPMNLLKEGGTQ